MGMLVLLSMVLLAILRAFVIDSALVTSFGPLATYPIFISAFLYGALFFHASYAGDDFVPFVAPALAWLLFVLNRHWNIDDFIDSRLLIFLLIILLTYLVRDTVAVISVGTGQLKKTFEFANPNYTGFLLNIIAWLWLLDKNRAFLFSFVFWGLMTVAIVATLSKTAYLIHALLFIFWMGKNKNVVLFFLPVFLVGVGFLVFVDNYYIGLLFQFFESDLGGAVSHRILLVNAALSLFLDNFLFGVGYGNYIEQAVRYYKIPIEVKTHNIILTLLAEAGIVGFLWGVVSQILLWVQVVRIGNKLIWVGLIVFYLFSLSHASGEHLIQFPLMLGIIHLLKVKHENNGIY